ncbi:glycosyltransferase family 2 protein [Metallosphaera tengchongensis]|uniref:Glycosyltransferase family 2 protein n=1 Tax=Metallosphaera tengchongensis TaxID=1532350 RepID=A0A6N0NU71_9CREN|nr:glycosyltransferase family 2 protein [Metallosphaera tengchongensis]QKQ99704.1 glycosyltransferase family 2 protein [Metallosphaera tengchongensis]
MISFIAALFQIAILLVPSAVLMYQYVLFKQGVRRKDSLFPIYDSQLPTLSVLVPTRGEKVEVIQGLLNNLSSVQWDKDRLEVVIVSDDSPEQFLYITKNLQIPPNLNVKIVRRERNVGYKSGALAHAFSISKGELVITLDVDARLDKDSLVKAYNHMRAFGCDAVTMNWVGYTNNKHSTLAKGLAISTSIADKSLLRGRDAIGLKIFPVGCGTMFSRRAIEEVGPWDPRMIQDDLEIGARLLSKGKRVCSSSSSVYVEVPDNLVAFYVQQTRWAMGSIEVLTRRFKEIMSKNLSVRQKIDILLFLLQYIPIALTFVAAAGLVITPLVIGKWYDYLESPLILVWITALSLYGYNFIKQAKDLGLKTVEAFRALGKISSYTVAISPFILIGLLSGLRRTRKYVVTPKGVKVTTWIQYPILFFGLAFISSSLIYFLHHSYITSLWLLYYSMGFLFTFFTFKREL